MAQIPSYNKIDYQNDSKLVVYAKQQAIAKAMSKTSPAVAAKTSIIAGNQSSSTRYEVPEYNKIDYKNDSLAVITAKQKAIVKAQGASLPIAKTNNTTSAPAKKTSAPQYEIPSYNKIDYANDSLAVIQAKRLAIANAQGANGQEAKTPTVSVSVSEEAVTVISPKTENAVKTEAEKKSEEAKAKKLKEAEDRKKKRDKEFQEKTAVVQKNSEEAAKNVQKYVAEQLKANTEKKKDKDKDKVASSSEALKEMKDNVKGVWKNLVSPLSGSLSDAAKNIKSDEAAKSIIGEIKKTSQGIGKIEDFLKGASGLSNEDLIKLSTKSILDFQKDILSQNLTQQAILDSITKRIAEQEGNIAKLAQNIADQYLVQKAYINTYLKNTLGNPEFMENMSKTIGGQVNDYIDALSNEKINSVNNRINTTIDNTFNRITSQVESTTQKINTKLDDLLKLDIVNDLNQKLEKSISLEAFEKRLNANPLTQVLSPSIMAICQAGKLSVLNSFKQPKMLETITKVQTKIKAVQENLNKAKEFIANKTKQLKEYVDNLKKKATEAVKQFANKVVADIKNKISVAISGALGSVAGGLL